MKRILKAFKHISTLLITLFTILIINIAVLFTLALITNNKASHVPVEQLSDSLTFNSSSNTWELSDDGAAQLEEYNCFALLIDNSGTVIWSYKLPEDIPTHYSLKDIVSFSRWYLNDYPVYSFIRDEGIFVAGTPKNSIWKYQLIFQLDTMDSFIQILVPLLISNIIILVTIPLLYFRKRNSLREQERTAWIAGVSHDIRTPLSLIMGYAGELANSDMDENVSQKALIIQEQSLKIRTLIQNLNTTNKLEYGLKKLDKTTFSLPALLRETICDIMNRKPDILHEFDINIDEDAENAQITGDYQLIVRLIENLVGNSIHHNKEKCKININLITQPHHYLLTIRDNGIGVTDEQLKNFNSSHKNDYLPEHGLGLRLVKQIALAHRFKIHFAQNIPTGFKCTLRINRIL